MNSFCRNGEGIGLDSEKNQTTMLHVGLGKKRNTLMTYCIDLQQFALESALPTGFLASAKQSSTSPASARKTSVAALPRRSLDRRTHQRS